MRPPHLRATASLLLAIHLGACTAWRPSTLAPRQLIEEENPRVVRVRGPDGVPVVVQSPRIEGDAIVMSDECRRVGDRRGRYVCPTREVAALSDVRSLEVRRISPVRTIGMLLLVLPVALYITAPYPR